MKTITRRGFVGGVAVLPVLGLTAADAQISASPAEARTIAKEAYVYGFPIRGQLPNPARLLGG
jgi:hypothetical protein